MREKRLSEQCRFSSKGFFYWVCTASLRKRAMVEAEGRESKWQTNSKGSQREPFTQGSTRTP